MMALLGFLLALVIVVAVHEWGHFYTARRLGIPVVRFSVGMGPAIWSKYWHGVEYRLAWLPVGGYVLFADPKLHMLPKDAIAHVFDLQPWWKKFLVVLAGPAVNFILAFVLMICVLTVGLQTPKAWVAPGAAGTPWAEVSGHGTWQVTAINDVAITQFEQLPIQLLRQVSAYDQLHFMLRDWQGAQKSVVVDAAAWRAYAWANPSAQLALWGVMLATPPLAAHVASVEENSAAALAGLQAGDQILSLNGMRVESFADLSQWVKLHPYETIVLEIERQGHQQTLSVALAAKTTSEGVVQGFLGIRPEVPADFNTRWLTTEGLTLSESVILAPQKLWDLTVLTVQAIGRLVSGQSGLEQLSGPIGIAQAAGNSLEQGWLRFFQFLALLSLSLGVLNLLPLPLLDGGHLLLYSVEGLRGRQLSEAFLLIWQKIGMVMIAGLTLLAITSDLKRLFGG